MNQPNTNLEFANLIKEYIQTHGMSQIKFAEEKGVSLDAVKSWCCGRAIPHHSTINLIFGEEEGWLQKARQAKASTAPHPQNQSEWIQDTSNDPIETKLSKDSPFLIENLPDCLFSKKDKAFLTQVSPSGLLMLYLISPRSRTPITFSEEELKLLEHELAMFDISFGQTGFPDFWRKVADTTEFSVERTKTLAQLSREQIFEGLPTHVFTDFLNHYLLFLSSPYFLKEDLIQESNGKVWYRNFKFPDENVRRGHITLWNIYLLCKEAEKNEEEGDGVPLAKWNSVLSRNQYEICDVLHVGFPGLESWPYYQHCPDHNRKFSLNYHNLLCGLLTQNISMEEQKNSLFRSKKTLYRFQNILSPTENSKQFLIWYNELQEERTYYDKHF